MTIEFLGIGIIGFWDKVSSMSSAIFLLPTLTSGGSGDNGMTHIGGVEGKDCVKNEGRKENRIVKV